MRIRSVTWVITMLAVASAASASPCSLPLRQTDAAPVFLYVNNGDYVNSVGAYRVAADGALSPVPGQPFLTGGGDVGGQLAIDSIYIVGRFLYVANSFSGDVSGFSIDPSTGALAPVPGSPFIADPFVATGTALTGTPDGRFLYAVLSGIGTVASFRINTDGSLSPLGELLVLDDSTAGARVSPDGRFLGMAQGGRIGMFTIDANGSLAAVSGSPFPGYSDAQSVDFTATRQSLVEGRMIPRDKPIDAFRVAEDGSLAELPGAPPTMNADHSGNILLSRDDNLAFVTGTSYGTEQGFVSTFRMRADGSIAGVVGSPVATGGCYPAGMATAPDGRRLFVSNGGESIAVFDIAPDGSLHAVSGSPFPIMGPRSISIAVYPSENSGTVPLTVCLADDATWDTFSEVVDSASPLYGLWTYRVAATGQVLRGTAEYVSFVPGRSLVSRDADDPAVSMSVSVSYATRTGTVRVVERRSNARHVLRDRNTADTPPCS